jgi:hypothetical protein
MVTALRVRNVATGALVIGAGFWFMLWIGG